MDLFDRAEDEPNSIKRGARYYYALVGRLAWSAGYGLSTHLGAEGTDEFWRLVHIDNLWGFCLVAAGWFVVSSVPVLGSAVNLYLSYYGLKDLWERLQKAGTAFDAWYTAAHEATTKEELEAASVLFAKGVAAGGFVVLELVVSKGNAKLLGRLLRKFPAPAWFRQMIDKARKKREERKQTPSALPGTPSRASLLVRGKDFVPPLLALEGAKNRGEEFPTGPILAGTAAVLGIAGAIWWSASAGRRRS